MDNADFYFTRAELAYRQERVRNSWRPVRRKRTRQPDVPPVGRPLDPEAEL